MLSLGSRLSFRQVGYRFTTWAREAYVIVMFDKYCSLMETFHKPVMELMEYQELTADLKKGFAAQ